MKRILVSIICLFILLFTCAFTENQSIDSIDLSGLTLEELIILRNRIDSEISAREKEIPVSDNNLSTDKEITFNDFVWGMDAKSALKLLVDKKLVESFASISSPASIQKWYPEDWAGEHYFEDCGMYISEWCWGKTSMAGYSVQETTAYFYFDYDDNILNRYEGDSHLYRINVCLTATDYDYAELDLANKLTNLFGDPIVTIDDTKYRIKTCHIWYGINDTAVSLYHYTSKDEDRYDQIYLIYGKTNAEQHLEAIEAMVQKEKKEKEKQNSSNYDGLY